MDRRRLLVRGGRALAGAVAGLGMSCGDFLNDYEGIGGHPEYRAEVTAMFWPQLAAGGELRRLEMTPMRIRRFRLEHAPEEDARWLADTLDRESGNSVTGSSASNRADSSSAQLPRSMSVRPRPRAAGW